MMTLAEYLALDAELRRLRGSFEYAYAMGHGCTIGGRDPRLQPVVDRVDELRRRLASARAEALGGHRPDPEREA